LLLADMVLYDNVSTIKVLCS